MKNLNKNPLAWFILSTIIGYIAIINGDFESSNLWKIDPTFDKTHSAVFPLELCNKIIDEFNTITK